MPFFCSSSTNDVPSADFWRSVSSYRMTPLMYLPRSLRREQHVAVGAAVFLDVLDLDAVEALLDRAGAFVGGEDAFAGGDHGLGDGDEILC